MYHNRNSIYTITINFKLLIVSSQFNNSFNKESNYI